MIISSHNFQIFGDYTICIILYLFIVCLLHELLLTRFQYKKQMVSKISLKKMKSFKETAQCLLVWGYHYPQLSKDLSGFEATIMTTVIVFWDTISQLS